MHSTLQLNELRTTIDVTNNVISYSLGIKMVFLYIYKLGNRFMFIKRVKKLFQNQNKKRFISCLSEVFNPASLDLHFLQHLSHQRYKRITAMTKNSFCIFHTEDHECLNFHVSRLFLVICKCWCIIGKRIFLLRQFT